ncbi:hypothetical protein MMC13_002726 [Lambiella insularis]|nr:hypothetical protein [Lambiella insularis]
MDRIRNGQRAEKDNEDAMHTMNGANIPNDFGESQGLMQTRVLPVDISKLGVFTYSQNESSLLPDWEIALATSSPDAVHLLEAARHLRETDVPVAFPTETVYGLGADATRSPAVRGIYAAKRRPVDNPLIVHVCNLDQLRGLLQPQSASSSCPGTNGNTQDVQDPIPKIYHALIRRFWPGPLTILLPNPPNSILAPEVTAGLPTFGARMPASPLALALIRTANVPLAAPSANASTKPSPTTAQHVLNDLEGRINIILDGGPCDVGVESTVVDGLSDPPSILRPGGISIEQLRACPGWESTVVAYKDGAQSDKAPRAPGMKYKHYSPKAKVVLVEAGAAGESLDPGLVLDYIDASSPVIGVLRTKRWNPFLTDSPDPRDDTTSLSSLSTKDAQTNGHPHNHSPYPSHPTKPPHLSLPPTPIPTATHSHHTLPSPTSHTCPLTVWDIPLGGSPAAIARGLFAALRELDQRGVAVIFVEGIADAEGDAAAAVMNRLRKAAEVEVKAVEGDGQVGGRDGR